jgi:type IV secretory pathway VirB3-like protein
LLDRPERFVSNYNWSSATSAGDVLGGRVHCSVLAIVAAVVLVVIVKAPATRTVAVVFAYVWSPEKSARDSW